jgi:hypothetical protein
MLQPILIKQELSNANICAAGAVNKTGKNSAAAAGITWRLSSYMAIAIKKATQTVAIP